MKRTSKYVGLDVHRATTVVAVRERSGRVIFRGVLPTEAGPLVEFFRGLAGTSGRRGPGPAVGCSVLAS